MTRPERQQSVLDILEEFRGLEPLKELFWSELNYQRVNQPLSRHGWSDTASKALVEDPILFAGGGQDNAFHVIYARLASDRLLLGLERLVVSRLVREHPYALSVLSSKSQDRWHLLNVKYDDDLQKRRVFRRITVGPEERLRTASERIALLDLASVGADLFGLSPLDIQARHDEAFDVEPVTVEFFREYARVFGEVEKAIEGITKQPERRRLFTQRLFNRLMFIAFIQKKGWLKLDGQSDYLSAVWESCHRVGAHGHAPLRGNGNFYRDRLKLLFFHALSTANEVNIIGINRGGVLRDMIGDVPYLNGGLFEEDEDDRDQKIVVPDESIEAILNELFDRFNFTVTESTPLDIEVAVDPEMLGKIFEELVTGRHETGSYYTPKPVVSFMCREALKGYLRTAVGAGLALPGQGTASRTPTPEGEDAIDRFVDEHDPSGLGDAEAVLEALRRIKVCDPACGSGAYLLGMLHELLGLRACLFANKNVDAISVYDRKLEIIQRNLYGVDIDPFAVNIARLRLWLSLAVEFEGSNPPPLPNLDYKVEAGDSLTAPDPSGGLEQGFRKALIDKFLSKKAEYLMAHGGRKVTLRKEIGELKETITGWAHGKGAVDGFDWPVEFAEVFLDGGFDVVLTNPPYVRMELFKSIKPVLRKNFPTVHAERADLYCYFYARALELLRQGGMQVFISSNKWLRANYGVGLRQYLAERCRILSITDFGDLPAFEATAYPMIFVAEKVGAHGHAPLPPEPPCKAGIAAQGLAPALSSTGKPPAALPSATAFTQVKSLEPPYPDVLAVIHEQGQALPTDAIDGGNWRLTRTDSSERLRKMEAKGTPLGDYVKGQIYYGVKTGLNEAFVIDGRTRDELIAASPRAREIIKRLAMGKDIRKWKVVDHDRWLIYMYHGIDTKGLSAVLNHLRPYRKQLEARATKQEWYELQQPQLAYAPAFAKPKVMYPIISNNSPFAFDVTGAFTNDKGFIIPVGDLYLLGVLNSSAVWSAIEAMCSPLRGGFFELRFVHMSKVPIPDAPPGRAGGHFRVSAEVPGRERRRVRKVGTGNQRARRRPLRAVGAHGHAPLRRTRRWLVRGFRGGNAVGRMAMRPYVLGCAGDLMHYDPKKHHRQSIRLSGYDYSSPGAYFITICSDNRQFLFGNVRDGQMQRNHYGEIVQEEWFRSATIRKEIQLDAWMVMPNHVHGIVMITPVGAHGYALPPGTQAGASNIRARGDVPRRAPESTGAHGHAPLPIPKRRPRSLGTFVGGLKGAVKTRINEMRRTPGAPVWQENYHEHIIRNEDELNKIREYILTNPSRWAHDRENPERQPTATLEEEPDWYV